MSPTNSPWIISPNMQQIIDKFENEILCQFLYVPCSICSKLMYSKKSKWIEQDSDTDYLLNVSYSNITLTTNPIPPPNQKRRYLSPIFLHCSLVRTLGANPFTEYQSFVGTINYSRNFYSLSLYFGLLDAFLEPQTATPWLDNSLTDAINWLKENNPFLHSYSQMLPSDLSAHLSLPVATHLPNDENVPRMQQGDI
ncbi:27400_t:CDS:2, partial [Racocetra persica]